MADGGKHLHGTADVVPVALGIGNYFSGHHYHFPD